VVCPLRRKPRRVALAQALDATAEHLGDLSFEPVVAKGKAAVGG
jgi:hypothetical protein